MHALTYLKLVLKHRSRGVDIKKCSMVIFFTRASMVNQWTNLSIVVLLRLMIWKIYQVLKWDTCNSPSELFVVWWCDTIFLGTDLWPTVHKTAAHWYKNGNTCLNCLYLKLHFRNPWRNLQRHSNSDIILSCWLYKWNIAMHTIKDNKLRDALEESNLLTLKTTILLFHFI